MRSRVQFVFAVALILVGCANQGGGSGAPGNLPSVVGQTKATSETCALASTDRNTFVLVRGATANNDCRVLLADLASSTIQTWQESTSQIPPSGAATLFCDLTAQSGNRVDVWGFSLQKVGSSICSQLQTGIIPAELGPPRPTPAPTVCSVEFGYAMAHVTEVVVRGPDAAAECASLPGKLPTTGVYSGSNLSVDWQVVMHDPGDFRVCQGTIGSSSIEVEDTAFSQPPTWTTAICAQIEAGTLGAAPAAVGGGSSFVFDPSSSDSLNAQEHQYLYTFIKPCPRAGCETASPDPRFAWMGDWEAPVPAEFQPCLTDMNSDACSRAIAGP